jgi:hypothetical protein
MLLSSTAPLVVVVVVVGLSFCIVVSLDICLTVTGNKRVCYFLFMGSKSYGRRK